MKFGLYSLLHLKEEESSAMNISVKDFRDQITVYLNCAITLSNSLRSKGIPFTLLTNRKAFLDEIVNESGGALCVLEIPFSTVVPTSTRFYSAHFKLDAFRYLSSLNDEYVGLCDLDMVCINDIPLCFSNIVKEKIPMWYDISEQVVPAYGHEVIIRDLETIHGFVSEGRWAGGEFISGTPEFFRNLMKNIDIVYDNYIHNISKLHHVGDEVLTSAALEMIRRKGTYVADAGTVEIVGRFWSSKILHHQKPFEHFQQYFLVHLPSDKRFLSDIASSGAMELTAFVDKYNAYRKKNKIKAMIGRIV
jgi:hypothetical protein